MKTSLVALLLVLANLASGQAPAPPASQPQASPRTANAKEGNQRSRRIQRLRRRGAAVGSRGQDQRAGSLSHSVSQQRDEGRCAGIADGNLPAGQQPGQGHRHGESAPVSEPGQCSRPGAFGLQRARHPEVGRRQAARRAGFTGGHQDGEAGWRFRRGFRQAEGPIERIAKQRCRFFSLAVERLRIRPEVSAAGRRS